MNTTPKRQLSDVSCKYGAPMGRRSNIPMDISTVGKLRLERLKWVDYDYDVGGAYWGGGLGNYIYWAYGETNTEQVDIFIRAKTRSEAKILIREKISYARFCR